MVFSDCLIIKAMEGRRNTVERIYLTGFMGVGKSAVGRMLAPRLELPFVDLDRLIESKYGTSIPRIFEERGEAYFRDSEFDTVQEIGKGVIALGGGAFIQEPLRDWVLQKGIVIFIDWPFDVIYRRVRNSKNRPLVQSKNQLNALFLHRYPLYQKAHITWQSKPPHRESVKQVVKGIQKLLKSFNS
jgi:shikimate kinase